MTKRSSLLVLALGVVLLIAIAVVGIPAYLASGSFRDRVTSELSQKLNRPVELESLRLSLLPRPRVVLEGVELGPPHEGPRSWIEVETADLTVRLGPLLRRQVEVVSLDLDSLDVRIDLPDSTAMAADGSVASPRAGRGATPIPPASGGSSGSADAEATQTDASRGGEPVVREGGSSGGGFDVAIEDFRLSRGGVHVIGPDGKPSLDLAGIEARLEATSARSGDLQLSGNASASHLRIHLPGGTLGEGLDLRVDPNLEYRAASDELAIAQFDLHLGGLPISVTGNVAGLRNERIAALEFSGGPTAIEGILGFLPSGLVPRLEGVRSSGTVALRGTVNGSLAETPPPFEVALSLTNGSIAHPQLPEPMTEVTLSLYADPNLVRIERLHAASANSNIDVAGSLSDYLVAPKADLRVQGDADLSIVSALQQEPDMPELSGRASADLTARGPLQDPARPLGIEGTVVLTGVTVQGGSMDRPIRNVSGEIRLDGSSLSTDGVSMEIGRSDYRISGSVGDYRALLPESETASTSANLRVVSRRLDLDELNEPRTGDSSADAAPTPAQSGEPQAPNAFFAMLSRMDGPVAFHADEMVVRNVPMRAVDATGKLQNGLVTLDRADLRMFGGAASAAGTVDLRNLSRPHLDLDLGLKGAEASELFAQAVTIDRLAKLGGYLSGTLDLTAKISGYTDEKFQIDLRSLSSLGSLSLHGGKLTGHPLQTALGNFLEAQQLSELPIREWFQPFSIENGRLQYEGLSIEALGGKLQADGWQALDGQIGMNATLFLPPELSQGLRRYVPRELQPLLFEPQAGRIAVPIEMSGPANAPRITLDSKKLEDEAKARLAQKVDAERQKLQEKVEDELEGRVEEVKDRLLDQLTGAPRDSAGSDSNANDLEGEVRGVLENLFRKKK